ncbi:MAG: hypothetical protein ACTSX1_04870 [Candidatus Heimdallarchaeaceae archaeon]
MTIYNFVSYLKEIKLKTMKLEKAKELFNEIVEICYQTENPKLIEAVQPLYTDVENAKDVPQIIYYAEELQICLNEIDIAPGEEDEVQEMHDKIEMLSE